jgi:hypothetical protein
MAHFSYNLPLYKTSTKPIDIYGGSGKVGVIRGFYGNIFTKILGKIGSDRGQYLDYELRDSENNIRIISKDERRFTRRKVLVKYIDDDNIEYEIVMQETKRFDIDEIKFTYKNQEYVINKRMFEPAELVLNGDVIADWKIHFTNYAYSVKMNIHNYAYMREHYLLLGLFHVSFS